MQPSKVKEFSTNPDVLLHAYLDGRIPPEKEGSILTEEKRKKVTSLLADLRSSGVRNKIAKNIVIKWSKQWEGCFVEPDNQSTTVLKQYWGHDRIVGLKVGGAANQRHADYPIKEIQGGVKKIKIMVRILPDGSITKLARFAKKDAAGKESFLQDAQREVDVRQSLVDAGNVLEERLDEELRNSHMKDYIVPCEKDPSHIGKQSDVKFRSTIEFAPQDLFHKALNPKTPFSDLAHALLNPLKGLRFMHIRGYVHADVKMENVLVFENGEGKLADLGFSGRIGTGCSGGTLGQFSSLFYGKGGLGLQLSQDMFSFGHLLLATMACKRLSLGTVSSQALCWTLTLANVERLRRKITSEIHREYIRLIQTTLREAADKPEYRPLYHLVADLISYNPNERPDSTETERRLTEDTSPAAVAGHSC